MKILVADKFEKIGLDGLKALSCDVVSMPDVGAEKLPGALAETNPRVLVVRGTKVSADAMGRAPALQVVIRAGAGYDTIDCAGARARNIAVCNCPGMNAAAVAELTLGLLLALDRRIVEQTMDLKAGVWNKKEYGKARGVKGSTLGVIGLGSIGREVIRRARAFGIQCFAHSLNMTPERALDLGVQNAGRTRADLLAMLPRCDAVTVHVAANKESDRMCDAEFFRAMKPGAAFINTSRGSVVDEPAMIEAIRTKGLRVGADVYAGEPAGGQEKWKIALADLPGVIGTHHIGASTDQAQNAVADEVVRIVKVFKETGAAENRVN